MVSCEKIPSNYAWSSDYLLNIHKIDRQHKALFSTVGKLYKLLLGHKDLQQIDSIFSELVRQTLVHFKTEEELLQTHGYPDYSHHKDQQGGGYCMRHNEDDGHAELNHCQPQAQLHHKDSKYHHAHEAGFPTQHDGSPGQPANVQCC